MKGNHIYQLVDDKGRVLIPKHYREATEIHTGDIVKLRLTDTGLSVEKVQLIEMGCRAERRQWREERGETGSATGSTTSRMAQWDDHVASWGSPAAMAAYVKAAIAYLPRQKRMELAAALIGQKIISGGGTENVL